MAHVKKAQGKRGKSYVSSVSRKPKRKRLPKTPSKTDRT